RVGAQADGPGAVIPGARGDPLDRRSDEILVRTLAGSRQLDGEVGRVERSPIPSAASPGETRETAGGRAEGVEALDHLEDRRLRREIGEELARSRERQERETSRDQEIEGIAVALHEPVERGNELGLGSRRKDETMAGRAQSGVARHLELERLPARKRSDPRAPRRRLARLDANESALCASLISDGDIESKSARARHRSRLRSKRVSDLDLALPGDLAVKERDGAIRAGGVSQARRRAIERRRRRHDRRVLAVRPRSAPSQRATDELSPGDLERTFDDRVDAQGRHFLRTIPCAKKPANLVARREEARKVVRDGERVAKHGPGGTAPDAASRVRDRVD